MRVLVVKLSSLGDVIHTLPALTDAAEAVPGLDIDWVVEDAFAEIPAWHTAVDRVIPVALRRWRRSPWRDLRGPEWRRACRALAARDYDLVVDAQGLLKSAFVARLARGQRVGLDWRSAREAPASLAYHRRLAVPTARHAVDRLRDLFAGALGYPRPRGAPDYGLQGRPAANGSKTIIFLHGSARREKLWPESRWAELARRAVSEGHEVALPHGSEEEAARAARIAADSDPARVRVLPPMSLAGLAACLRGAAAVVAVDTGPGHLAAALGVPGLSLYGPTRPERIGTLAPGQVHLDGCGSMAAIEAGEAWAGLERLLRDSGDA